MQHPQTLADWLAYAEQQHAVGIDLGLERVTRVAQALGFSPPDHRPAPRVLTIAGTNGKGSTTTFAERLLLAAGLRVGATLSPHVHHFNERVRLDGEPVDDAQLCTAFAAVEAARGEVPLTYFEYSALVALWLFRAAAVDVAVLEIGLGGRLDAFNLVGADVAVITSIGLDHAAFLGDDLEGIGREKAGVMRPGRPAVLGADVTTSVHSAAAELGCPVYALGQTCAWGESATDWWFDGRAGRFTGLPWGRLAPHNCALAIEAVGCFIPVTSAMVEAALATADLPGRFEHHDLAGRQLILDVAHNPAGARFLAQLLTARHEGERFVALLGTLADKDAAGLVAALADRVDRWICVPTTGPRGQTGAELAARLGGATGPTAGVDLTVAASVDDGLRQAIDATRAGDGILAFGSFSLVENLRNAIATGLVTRSPLS